MRFAPQRALPLALLGCGSLVLACTAAFCVWRLLGPPLDWGAALALLGLCSSVLAFPWMTGRIVLLLRAAYEIDPRALTIHWGPRLEVVPLNWIEVIRTGRGIPERVRAAADWIGWASGRREVEGSVKYFVSQPGDHLILVSTPSASYLLSPADPVAFAEAFRQATERGTAELVSPESRSRTRLWERLRQDQPALWLIVLGAVALLGLSMFLIAVQPALSQAVPFGFDPSGHPASLGSPARLLLLPAAGALAWGLDVLLGLFAFDRSDRASSLTLWFVGLVLVLGLWVGALSLLAAG